MTRKPHLLLLPLLAAAGLVAACGRGETTAIAAAAPVAVAVHAVPAARQPIDRFLRVTGTLMADEQADVAAETSGRVVGTPVERGSHVTTGSVLVRISADEADASLREAQANAAQIEARLGLQPGQSFDPSRVPEVLTAKASLDLAQSDFNRIKALLDQKVVSQAEYDQKLTAVRSAEQQYLTAQNSAQQSFRSLQAARARVDLAQKTAADTTVRAPFAGLVAERLVTTGDYVNKGTKVATVVNVDPLRVQLTVPEQYLALVTEGQPVKLAVDAYPGQAFTAKVRFVSPALRADQRALTVEAIAPNADGRLKPGLFVTALLQQPNPAPAILVPATAVETLSGTSRVYVVKGDAVEERIVTTGESVGDRIEISRGVSAGERVVSDPHGKLADGARVHVEG